MLAECICKGHIQRHVDQPHAAGAWLFNGHIQRHPFVGLQLNRQNILFFIA